MDESPALVSFRRSHVLVAVSIPLLYLVYLSMFVLWRVPILCEAWMEMGIGPIPWVTRLLILTYQYWIVPALALAGATVHFAFCKKPTAWQAIALFMSAATLALAFHAIWREGLMRPMIDLIESLGQ